MNDPKCKRFHRKYDNFSLCVNIGEKGYVLAEHPNDRYTIFYYGIYGSGLFGKVFDKESPILLQAKKDKIIDVQKYVNDKVLFESLEDFYLIGFNTLDKNIKWDAKVFSNVQLNYFNSYENAYLICFAGDPTVNEKKFKRYDYASILKNKEYQLNLKENDVIVVFNQIGVWK